MEAAARDIQPDLMALVGSPVPMVIGADLEGIAVELEERTGIPSFGFDTTGTAYYDRGAFRAAKALMDRYTAKQAAKEAAIERRVNILGALPMDFGKGEEIDHLCRFSGADLDISVFFQPGKRSAHGPGSHLKTPAYPGNRR